MARTSIVERNKKRLAMIKRYADKRVKLKSIANDVSVDPMERFEARLKLAELPRNSSPSRYRLRCGLTGRGNGNYRKFELCRHKFRELASKGQIPGVIKASW